MVPGLDTRLRSIAKAIEQVILPALPAHEKLAREQAEIAVGHLRVLETQWPFVTRMAYRELQLMMGLAASIVEHLPSEAGQALFEALEAAKGLDEQDFNALDRANADLGEAIEGVLKSGSQLDDAIKVAVLQHARAQSRLERVWFAASGISDVSGLPSIEGYLSESA